MRETPEAIVKVGTVLMDSQVQAIRQYHELDTDAFEPPLDPENYGRRVNSLTKDCNLSTKRAHYQTLDEMTGLSRNQISRLLNIAEGTVRAMVSQTQTEIDAKTIGHYSFFDHPMNFLAKFELPAEDPADAIFRYYFYQFSYATSDPHPNGVSQQNEVRPQYAVVTETVGPNNSLGYSVDSVDINRYPDHETVVTDLYETEYFSTVERATEWLEILNYVFEKEAALEPEENISDVEPESRLDPDR